ncbi:hypothetical protein Acid345_3422 [Candidatus Koribacter versatilis Ellin345]|uniref:Uncharacterized protein n=1 Tax=Koribacter versatilis (strain Ellin345) TaxID=204669 RepID=Q1IL27_KORVE|nr:hypothetical protein [Candidatus Koribacter versatilis]ABF42423.1 hypothetical protein Acid345_3422 [Candidatus Koribacter versatilis Ellin345]
MAAPMDTTITAILPRTSGFALAGLVDIETAAGDQFFVGTLGGTFPSRFDGSPQIYKPWVKSAGPFKLTRTLRTDGGDVVFQNIIGNLIQRDVGRAFAITEFEGAYAVVRYWNLLAEKMVREFHGYMSAAQQPQGEVHFKLLQLLDGSDVDLPERSYANNCSLRFKSERCGSTSTNLTCPKTLGGCTAVERFDGVPTPPPIYILQTAATPESLKNRGVRPVRRLGL